MSNIDDIDVMDVVDDIVDDVVDDIVGDIADNVDDIVDNVAENDAMDVVDVPKSIIKHLVISVEVPINGK